MVSSWMTPFGTLWNSEALARRQVRRAADSVTEVTYMLNSYRINFISGYILTAYYNESTR